MAMTMEEKYQQAVNAYTHVRKGEELTHLRDVFAELGDYKGSAMYLQKCENYFAHDVGNIVTFGTYKGKELRWKVLRREGFRCLLFAEEAVDHLYFYPERVNCTWQTSTLRKWLNKQFIEDAFSVQERMNITLTALKNNVDPRWDDENGPDTKDKMFVFNLTELNEYVPEKEDRSIGDWWWLRGHGCSNLNQQAVYEDGTVYINGVSSNSDEVGVRPAMWIRLR